MKRAAWLAAVLLVVGCAAVVQDARRSGFEDMGASTQAMQSDDTANPAMLWVRDGEQRFASQCASCHGELKGMRGVAARYPAWDEKLSRPVNLGTRINLCRQRYLDQPAWSAEQADLLALEAAVAMQSRGMPISPPDDPRLAASLRNGARLYRQRIGQIDLSCAQCHAERAGQRLAGSVIPQGQATGYPIYRLEWQGLGSLGRRIRNCMTGVRAEPLAHGSVEMVELELQLAARARGMPVETPAVRP
ncbi:MAG: sulfur oxidation c-type cytochrome SoxA [Burkholderiales bacterium]|nr:sulfur oxidation c-type cytochrome SoxA [Burkholderiales bacterium]